MFAIAAVLAAATPTTEALPPIDAVVLAPPYAEAYQCSEHWEGQLAYPGDALGQDCLIVGGVEGEAGFGRLYRTDGARNEDWYGWGAKVLAPFDGTIVKVSINPVVNDPGSMGKPPASIIIFQRADGVKVMFAHVAAVMVKEGEHVVAGQQVAVVGNNGFSRSPHIHIGAWRDKTPLQIRWNLRAMGRRYRGD